jgi:hypothetical protein
VKSLRTARARTGAPDLPGVVRVMRAVPRVCGIDCDRFADVGPRLAEVAMGARGVGAHVTNRAPHKNQRPHARVRARSIEVGSPGYWDLLLGGARHWPDPYCAEREQAWREWKDRIYQRWPLACSKYGARPAAWWSFDFPPLLVRAWDRREFSEAQTDAMMAEELVYWLDADEVERREIEQVWRSHLRLVGAEREREIFDVPAWFIARGS